MLIASLFGPLVEGCFFYELVGGKVKNDDTENK